MPHSGHSNEEDHIRRNPQDAQGRVRGNWAGDIVGDETEQADDWRELEAEAAGESPSRMEDVGNAQDALLAGSRDLDNVRLTRTSDEPEDERSKKATGHEGQLSLGAGSGRRRPG